MLMRCSESCKMFNLGTGDLNQSVLQRATGFWINFQLRQNNCSVIFNIELFSYILTTAVNV